MEKKFGSIVKIDYGGQGEARTRAYIGLVKTAVNATLNNDRDALAIIVAAARDSHFNVEILFEVVKFKIGQVHTSKSPRQRRKRN